MHALLDQFKNKKVLIVGDVMVDAYIIGKVDRVSPEAPVPVVNIEQRDKNDGSSYKKDFEEEYNRILSDFRLVDAEIKLSI
jgi:hypothetical protein